MTGKPVEDRRIPPGQGHASGPNTTDKVVLTFDDCPKTLDDMKSTVTAIEALGVRVVLFPLGNCIAKGTFDVDFARQHGMFVYSHSVNHPQLTKISDAAILKQLKPPAVQGTWLRPPYGAANAHVASVVASAGMKIWLWDFDTEDWRGKPQDQLVSEVVQYSEPGDTVLMHMQWHGFNADAVAKMKQGLAARGIELCGLNGPATATGPFNC
ncbi:polysaccharide deacetylase family protein [Propioniciclava coleopterorum]|uniref:Polysaccharide deacetylase family protein n=1 Tax=Propioniciclava coleopterorum TaxID=2714937 RepID=A0A6G7Y6B9_9ACTN|nr:polysaccharide deacetylase family protein [Propioniciclava coleopterorum]QIK72355.1 polysaccharide deacetylase family protein [Propioniciclava coleopterorum]